MVFCPLSGLINTQPTCVPIPSDTLLLLGCGVNLAFKESFALANGLEGIRDCLTGMGDDESSGLHVRVNVHHPWLR